jgi:GntR family transcriptional regulator/MocR family aminotransferase
MARIGFIVADRNVALELKKIRRYEIRNISGHEQRSLALFIRDGGYAKLVRSLRRVSKERWNSCQSLLNEMLPDWTAAPSVGGSNLWVAAPKGMDTMDLAKILRQEGVVIEPGSVFFAKPEDGRSFVKLGFNLMNENKQRQGFLKIKAAAERIGYGLTD